MSIFVTGASGYIGTHTCAILLEKGYDVIGLDNLSNSTNKSLDPIKLIPTGSFEFIEGDISDKHILDEIFSKNKIDCVIHLAAFKSVEESVLMALSYYANNVSGTINLLNSMKTFDIKSFIFSSSAAVYGSPVYLPIDEDHPTKPISPYGNSKAIVEKILEDLHRSDPSWSISCLRYFNPVGSNSRYQIGEIPNRKSSNLMPLIAMVANGKLKNLEIFGDDYDTKDGTGIRDYIHIMDLAEGHIAAMEHIKSGSPSYAIYNLGTGIGYSVKEVIDTFKSVSNRTIKYKIKDRRAGDVASCYADCKKAESNLNWRAKRSLKEMCQSVWQFSNNYED